MEMGGMTAFLYLMTVRDYIFEHMNHLTGARLTYSYVRIGGLARDLPEGWLVRLEEILQFTEQIPSNACTACSTATGSSSTARATSGDDARRHALNWGYTGPILRSTGLPMDLRKDTPYLAYGELEFEIPVGIKGDNYDRYYVRMREIDESIAHDAPAARSCCSPAARSTSTTGAWCCPTSSCRVPEIESLINHFKLVTDGPQVPAGEAYSAHEGAQRRARLLPRQRRRRRALQACTCARPASSTWAACTRCWTATSSPDIVPTFGSINMIGGECDR